MDVLIYSPFQLFGECLERCLKTLNDIVVVAVVRDEECLRKVLDRLSIDLLLVDMVPGLDYRQFVSLSADYPGLVSLAVGLPEQEAEVVRCGRVGFAGYVPRDASLETLGIRMRECIGGRQACPDGIASGLLRALRVVDTASVLALETASTDAAELKPCRLSAREVTVTRLLRRGLSNKEIARELDISVATVKHHVHSLLEKLGFASRVFVARAAPDSSWGLDARESGGRSNASRKRA